LTVSTTCPFASATPVDTALAGVSSPARWASLGGVAFFLQGDLDADQRRLVTNVLAHFSMRPLADLLVGLITQVHFVGNVADVTNHDGAGFAFHREVHNCSANLVADVPGLAVGSAFDPVFGPLQSAVASRPTLATALQGSQLSQLLAPTLHGATQFPSTKNNRCLLVANRRRVNLTQVNRNRACSWCNGRFELVIDHNMPNVALGFAAVDKAHLKDTSTDKAHGQNNLDWFKTTRTGKDSNASFNPDPCCFPNRGTKELSFPGITGILKTRFLQSFGGLARLVESFLGSVPAMGVQSATWKQVVIQAHRIERRQPNAMLAKDAPVGRQSLGIDARAFTVAFIQPRLWLSGKKDLREDHSIPSAFAFSRMTISKIAVWDMPSFITSSLSKRVASGDKRTLVLDFSFFIRQLYNHLTYEESANGRKTHNQSNTSSAKAY